MSSPFEDEHQDKHFESEHENEHESEKIEEQQDQEEEEREREEEEVYSNHYDTTRHVESDTQPEEEEQKEEQKEEQHEQKEDYSHDHQQQQHHREEEEEFKQEKFPSHPTENEDEFVTTSVIPEKHSHFSPSDEYNHQPHDHHQYQEDHEHHETDQGGHVTPAAHARRRDTETKIRVFRQSFLEKVNTTKLKGIFKAEVRVTVNEEMDRHVERVKEIDQIYTHLSKSLKSYSDAVTKLNAAEDELQKFFNMFSVRETEPDLRELMLKNVEVYKNLTKQSHQLKTTATIFSGNVSTFLDKVIKDSVEGVRIYQSARVEMDAFKEKLAGIEAKLAANKNNDRLKREFDVAKKQLADSEGNYIVACDFLKSKVELLNDTKTHRLLEQFTLLSRSQKKYYEGGVMSTAIYK